MFLYYHDVTNYPKCLSCQDCWNYDCSYDFYQLALSDCMEAAFEPFKSYNAYALGIIIIIMYLPRIHSFIQDE